jgi:hypothetical protein
MIFAGDIGSFARYQGFPLFSAIGYILPIKKLHVPIEISSEDFPVSARGDS